MSKLYDEHPEKICSYKADDLFGLFGVGTELESVGGVLDFTAPMQPLKHQRLDYFLSDVYLLP